MARAMRWAAVAIVAAVAGAVGVAPASSAQAAPSITISSLAAVEGDVLTITLTGCTDGAVPELVLRRNRHEPDTVVSVGTFTSTGPGTWEATQEVGLGGDLGYSGRCATGEESPVVWVDVEWREMFSTPFLSGRSPIDTVWGTDCDDAAVVVTFRSGERVWEAHPVADAGGDWEAPVPKLIAPATATAFARCGRYQYIPINWIDGAAPPFRYPIADTLLSPGEGPPGSPIHGEVQCGPHVPTVTRSDVGSDVVVDVAVARLGSSAYWGWDVDAGSVDVRFQVRCLGLRDDVLRYDVEAPTMRLASETVDGAGEPTRLVGTDCPAGTEATVAFDVEGERSERVAAIDLFGDWSVALPRHTASDRVVATASCGDVTYEPVVLGGDHGPEAPAVDPGTDPPAATPVSGSASYTG